MMIIVGITRRSGVFQYLAVKAVRIAKGEPIRILIALATITAILSAFLDNVTTVLLIVPITFTIADSMDLNPVPFLMSLTPIIIVIHIVTMVIFYFLYRNKLQVNDEIKAKVVQVNPLDEIKDFALLKKVDLS